MGDRANIILEEDGKNAVIYLYTHWAGTELPETLQNALIRGKSRWDDPPYLGRIIFCEMVKGNEMDLTGYGMSVSECDNGHPFLRVNADKQTVTIDFDPVRAYHNHPNKTFTFEEYIAIKDISWNALGDDRE